ncbi:MAG: response regulator [Methanobacteriota archaeon]|nr:MAG: response regulator [Euryarchaeota archaeon]
MKKKKILVVDDEEDIRYILRRLLEEEDYEVVEASGGPQCLELIKREKPDLVILDILMPDLNGWEVCRTLKESPSLPKMPVAMLSVLGDTEDMKTSLDYALADSHLTKPVDFPVLSMTIKELLKKPPKRPEREPEGSGSAEFFTPHKFDDNNT